MIVFDRRGLAIDETDWDSATPYEDGVRIQFRNQTSVYLSEELLRHALELIEFDRERRGGR